MPVVWASNVLGSHRTFQLPLSLIDLSCPKLEYVLHDLVQDLYVRLKRQVSLEGKAFEEQSVIFQIDDLIGSGFEQTQPL